MFVKFTVIRWSNGQFLKIYNNLKNIKLVMFDKFQLFWNDQIYNVNEFCSYLKTIKYKMLQKLAVI